MRVKKCKKCGQDNYLDMKFCTACGNKFEDDDVDVKSDSNTNIEYDVFNVLSDYMNELKDMAKVVTLSDSEYYTYRFKPKLLAKYLYGNTELYFIILWLNDMWSVKDFDLRKIKLIKNTDLAEALSKINASEKAFIKAYNETALATY